MSDDSLSDRRVRAARLDLARRAVAEAGLAALLVSPGADLRYLTGYDALPQERLTCLVVPAAGDPTLVVPLLDEQAAIAGPAGGTGVDILSWCEDEDPSSLVASLLPRSGPVAVGDRMWAAHALALRAAAPRCEQRPASRLLSSLRVTKSAGEVAALREASAAIDTVLAGMDEWLRVGRTERAVASDVSAAILRAGHAALGCVIVASGPNGALPHHQASDRVIRRDDVVVVDISGVMPSGYFSDSTRTYVLGEPDRSSPSPTRYCRRRRRRPVAAVRAGVTAATVDAAARERISAAGYGRILRAPHRPRHRPRHPRGAVCGRRQRRGAGAPA